MKLIKLANRNKPKIGKQGLRNKRKSEKWGLTLKNTFYPRFTPTFHDAQEWGKHFSG